MAQHELTLTAVDPDRGWGPVRVHCTTCGNLGIFAGPYTAYETHNRLGAAAVVVNSAVRGVSLKRH